MLTTLDLLRHGEARALAAGGDAARALSPHGELMVDRLGAHLATLGWRPARVFRSPLLRAEQTASRVLGAAGIALEPEVLAELATAGGPDELLAALEPHTITGAHVLLVGHQPLLGDVAGWCCGGAPVPLTPAQLVRVTFDGPPARGSGTLRLAFRPDRL
ncbi:MAG: SixA phosphatase family protein [Candidatus Eisenbacteria bacterium]